MIRLEMRDLLRRFLQDTSADIWDDSELNSLLNLGTEEIQGFIEASEADSFIYIDRADLKAGLDLYPKPIGMTSEISLAFKDSAAATEYKQLELVTVSMIRNKTAPAMSYAHYGRHFQLSWKPSATIADGLQIEYHPTIAMADDGESPDVHPRLHYAIVLSAAIKALRETPDEAKSFKEDLAVEVRKIPMFYLKSSAMPEPLVIDLDQRY